MNWLVPTLAVWLLVQMYVLSGGVWISDVHWAAMVLIVAPNSVFAAVILIAWYLP